MKWSRGEFEILCKENGHLKKKTVKGIKAAVNDLQFGIDKRSNFYYLSELTTGTLAGVGYTTQKDAKEYMELNGEKLVSILKNDPEYSKMVKLFDSCPY